MQAFGLPTDLEDLPICLTSDGLGNGSINMVVYARAHPGQSAWKHSDYPKLAQRLSHADCDHSNQQPVGNMGGGLCSSLLIRVVALIDR
jgi:hypothetical protein